MSSASKRTKSQAGKSAPRKSPAAPPAATGSRAPAAKPADPPGTPPPPEESERVAREIQRTEFLLTRATTVTARARNPRASQSLVSAQDFQAEARDAYKVRQYARAQRLTQAARDYAERAIRIVGPAVDDPEYVKGVLDRTDDALDRLKDFVKAGGGGPGAERRRDQLRRDQKAARELFRDGDVSGAYKATVGVREGVLDLLRGKNLSAAPISRETAEKAVKSAERARKNAVDDIGPKPNAQATRFLALADQQIAKARVQLSRGSAGEALLYAKAAERQLERAVDAARPAQASR